MVPLDVSLAGEDLKALISALRDIPGNMNPFEVSRLLLSHTPRVLSSDPSLVEPIVEKLFHMAIDEALPRPETEGGSTPWKASWTPSSPESGNKCRSSERAWRNSPPAAIDVPPRRPSRGVPGGPVPGPASPEKDGGLFGPTPARPLRVRVSSGPSPQGCRKGAPDCSQGREALVGLPLHLRAPVVPRAGFPLTPLRSTNTLPDQVEPF